jgi:hypothetical protein
MTTYVSTISKDAIFSGKKKPWGTLHNIVKGLWSTPNHPIMSKYTFIAADR